MPYGAELTPRQGSPRCIGHVAGDLADVRAGVRAGSAHRDPQPPSPQAPAAATNVHLSRSSMVSLAFVMVLISSSPDLPGLASSVWVGQLPQTGRRLARNPRQVPCRTLAGQAPGGGSSSPGAGAQVSRNRRSAPSLPITRTLSGPAVARSGWRRRHAEPERVELGHLLRGGPDPQHIDRTGAPARPRGRRGRLDGGPSAGQ